MKEFLPSSQVAKLVFVFLANVSVCVYYYLRTLCQVCQVPGGVSRTCAREGRGGLEGQELFRGFRALALAHQGPAAGEDPALGGFAFEAAAFRDDAERALRPGHGPGAEPALGFDERVDGGFRDGAVLEDGDEPHLGGFA